jgi:hypothetical protein
VYVRYQHNECTEYMCVISIQQGVYVTYQYNECRECMCVISIMHGVYVRYKHTAGSIFALSACSMEYMCVISGMHLNGYNKHESERTKMVTIIISQGVWMSHDYPAVGYAEVRDCRFVQVRDC